MVGTPTQPHRSIQPQTKTDARAPRPRPTPAPVWLTFPSPPHYHLHHLHPPSLAESPALECDALHRATASAAADDDVMPAPTASSLAAAADPALPAAFLSLPSPLLPASPPLPAAPAPSSNAFCVPRGPARAVAVSVSVSAYGAGSTAAASRLHRMWAEFSRFVRLHGNQIAPLGFASLGLGVGGGGGGSGEGAGGGGGGGGGEVDGLVEEEGVARAEAPKKVLILMSDTGGGHRASAEAIKAAFIQEFGDDYQVRFILPAWRAHLIVMCLGFVCYFVAVAC